MKILAAVLCLAALWCPREVGSHPGQGRSLSRAQFPHRERVPLERSISPEYLRQRSHRVPRGPPVRVTNAHSGIEKSAASRSQGSGSVPKAVLSPAPPLQRRVRRVRKRRPVSRRPSARQLSETAAKPVNHRFAQKIVEGTLQNVRGGARLISASGNYGYVPLVNKLIDNATLIRENLVEGFDCKGRTYGYYADQLNDCQIFHICVPMKQIFPDHFTDNDVYHFSFICPEFTIFSQDAMVCAWEGSAVPCAEAHNLYYMNQNFFVVSNDDVQKETTSGYGQAVGGGSRPPQTPSPYPPQPQPVAAGTYPVAPGGSSPAATAAPPPPAYPTPNVSQPTPANYPTPPRPLIQPLPQTPSPIIAYPSQRSETIETVPDTTQPETTTTTAQNQDGP